MATRLKAGILIVSDTAAKDPTTDATGNVLRSTFDQDGGESWEVTEVKIVPDSISEIQRSVLQWSDGANAVNLVITSGGTGFAIKDNTPEAVSSLIHRHAPGLVHGMLSAMLVITPFALMSRPVAGTRNKTLIITLPGSPKGAKENLQSIIKLLPHACIQAAGADSRALHKGGVERLEREAGIKSGHGTKSTGHTHSPDHGHGHHRISKSHTDPASRPKSNDPNADPTRRYRESPYPMLSVAEALDIIESETPPPNAIQLPVKIDLGGFVLAEDITANEPVPAFRASIVDGYAVNVGPNGANEKGIFPVASVSHATAGEINLLPSGQIARVTTGAPLPPGSNAVVMVEDTLIKDTTEDSKEEKSIEILTDEVKAGENVREIGSDIKAGSVILRKGEEITAVGGELGLLASVGSARVSVYKKPRIGVLSTGDEIVQHDRPEELLLGEVRDCNRPTIMSAADGWGFEVVDLGITKDRPGALEEDLRAAFRQVDVVITTGGVSMGELDLLKPTIERSLGGTIHFGRVAMKPGKPTTFATVYLKDYEGIRQKKLIFSLPGNPASAVVTFHLFVLPSLQKAAGIEPAGLPKVLVTCDEEIKCDPKRPEYHRAFVTAGRDGMLHATSTGMQRSSRIGSLKSANALLCLKASETPISKGDRVEALMMGMVSGIPER